jgi:hypothetical protein
MALSPGCCLLLAAGLGYAYENPEFLVLNLALGGGYPASVNKVTTPYRGLPASTVEMIKAGKAKVLVDWVKITQK